MYLGSQRNLHIQTSFLNEKDLSSAKIFVFLKYAYFLTSGERCQRTKKGENQSTLIHPVTPKAARAKAPLPSVLPRHFTSCLVCLCKSQEDLLAPISPWLSSREWQSSCVPCLCFVPSGQDYSPQLTSHVSMRAYATTAVSSHCELRVDFKP